MIRRFTTGILIAFLVVTVPAQSQIISLDPQDIAREVRHQKLTACEQQRFYSIADKDTPELLKPLFTGFAEHAVFRTCIDGYQHVRYFLRQMAPSVSGVCRFKEGEFYPGKENDYAFPIDGIPNTIGLKGWQSTPPEEWNAQQYQPRKGSFALVGEAFVTQLRCPPVTDKRYIPVSNIPDGMLKSFAVAWQQATSSEEALDKAFPLVPIDDKTTMLFRESFRQSTIFRFVRNRQSYTSIVCGVWDSDNSCRAWFDNHENGGNTYVKFDVVDGRLVLQSLAMSSVY